MAGSGWLALDGWFRLTLFWPRTFGPAFSADWRSFSSYRRYGVLWLSDRGVGVVVVLSFFCSRSFLVCFGVLEFRIGRVGGCFSLSLSLFLPPVMASR